MNKQFEQVREFHTACNMGMPEKPTMLNRGDRAEDENSLSNVADILEGMCNRMKVTNYGAAVMKRAAYILEETIELLRAKTIEDQADALADIQYFTLGTHTLMGVKPESIFDIVHSANMGKVGPDGKVTRDDQGKIQKPDGWYEKFAPEQRIRAEIERQSEL